jgi:hypothetical protein
MSPAEADRRGFFLGRPEQMPIRGVCERSPALLPRRGELASSTVLELADGRHAAQLPPLRE